MDLVILSWEPYSLVNSCTCLQAEQLSGNYEENKAQETLVILTYPKEKTQK